MIRVIRRVWNRLAGTIAGHRQETELAEEFETHLEMLTEANIRKGMPPELARREALLTFGGIAAAKESYRDQRGLPWIENLRRDIRYAIRGMRRNPWFTAVAVASLALGIGANAGVFSIANAVIIRALPVKDPGQLVLFRYESRSDIPATIRRTQVGDDQNTFPYYFYEGLRPGTETMSGVVAFVPLGMNQQSLTVQTGGQTTVAGGEMVSGNYFQVLGIAPILGRAIVDEDLEPGAPDVVVASHRFWLRELGGEPSAIGRSITINRQPFTVIGVTPPQFFGINPATAPDIWIALRDLRGLKPWGRLRPGPGGLSPFADRGYWWCYLVGRMKPGIPKQQVLAEADTLFRKSLTATLREPIPAARLPHISLSSARRGMDNLRRTLSEPILILMAAVSLVLLVACCNVATLLLARNKAREREILIRLELGAGRLRLVGQLLTESILLSLCGGAVGLLLGPFLSDALARMFLASSLNPVDVRPDATVLSFTLIISVLIGSMVGLAPALRATRTDLAPQLNAQTGRTSPRFTLSRFLVGSQAALAVLLLFGAGLFVRTLDKLNNQDLGFDQKNLLLFEIDPRRAGASPDRTLDIYNRALEKIQDLPGVRSASLSATAILSGSTDGGPVTTDGAPRPEPDDIYFNIVGPEFMQTMGIQVLRGRDIDWRDIAERRSIAIVNEAMARRLFENQVPVGRRFSFEVPYDAQKSFEIVGIVRNAKYDGMRTDPPPIAYLPYGAMAHKIARMCFEVRTAGDPVSMVPALRQTMSRIEPALPLMDIRTQSVQVERALEHERMFAKLSSLFGLLALILVAVGLYGTLAYAVVQRTGEIGIRVALGATPTRVLWMVLRESLLLAGCGLVVGLPVALALSELAASRLFGVTAHDSVTVAGTTTLLLLTAAAAGFVPAHRASRIDPLMALRQD